MRDTFLRNSKFYTKFVYLSVQHTFISLKNVKSSYIRSFMIFLISALSKLSATLEIHLSFPRVHAFLA